MEKMKLSAARVSDRVVELTIDIGGDFDAAFTLGQVLVTDFGVDDDLIAQRVAANPDTALTIPIVTLHEPEQLLSAIKQRLHLSPDA